MVREQHVDEGDHADEKEEHQVVGYGTFKAQDELYKDGENDEDQDACAAIIRAFN